MAWKVKIMGHSVAENTCITWSPAALGCLGSYCPILKMGKLRLRSQSTYPQAPPTNICPAPESKHLWAWAGLAPQSTTAPTFQPGGSHSQYNQVPTPQGSPQSLRGSSDQSRQSLTELHTLSREMHSPLWHLNLLGPSQRVTMRTTEEGQVLPGDRRWLSAFY